ncbi:unnamed protein product [Discula destructiva]
MQFAYFLTSLFTATVSAHGAIKSPPSRKLGPGMTKLCGQTAFDIARGDVTASLETVAPNITEGCPLSLCRGHQFSDNMQVSVFRPGQVVPMQIELIILHGGPANVSIVKTATNTVIGPPLIHFDDYGNRDLGDALPPNNTNFAITLPTEFSHTDCRVAGDCVLQWFWATIDAQTYVGCSDFVLFGNAVL